MKTQVTTKLTLKKETIRVLNEGQRFSVALVPSIGGCSLVVC